MCLNGGPFTGRVRQVDQAKRAVTQRERRLPAGAVERCPYHESPEVARHSPRVQQ